jgi:hypothetical protein
VVLKNCAHTTRTISRPPYSNAIEFHFEELPVFLNIIFARTTIARFCQKVKNTLNQDRMTPSNHASNKILAVTRTIATITTLTAVEVFICSFEV